MPRPAMLVAMVTAPLRPAWATISASRSCCLALRTLCLTPFRLSKPAEFLGLFDGNRADQHRLSALIAVLDLLDDGRELFFFRPIDHVGVVEADHRPIRRDDVDVEIVNLGKLRRFRVGRTGHARRASCTCGNSSGT